MMAEPLAAALHGVAKHYHGFTLGPLNLEIPAGSIVGLIGENGAGKTTLLKLLTGVNRPDAGTVELLSATPDDAAVRAKIGVVFEDAYFYESLTPAQVGTSLRGIFGPAWDAGYFAALLEQFHLPPKKSIKELSRGMRMKLNLASALAHRPRHAGRTPGRYRRFYRAALTCWCWTKPPPGWTPPPAARFWISCLILSRMSATACC